MSFFVSKELETLVDEDCLLDKEVIHEKILSLEDSSFKFKAGIDKISFEKNIAKIEFKANLIDIESILTSNLDLGIKLASKKILVNSCDIVELKRFGKDSYIVMLDCVLEKEF